MIDSNQTSDVEEVHDASSKAYAERLHGAVTCCWCGEFYEERKERFNCQTCGGKLPLPPSTKLGPKPEDEPRELPKGFAKKFFISNNASLKVALFIIILPLPFFWWIPFNLIVSSLGLCILLGNFNILYKEYRALKKGKAVEGKIEKIESFGGPSPANDSDNKSSSGAMIRLYFLFEINGKQIRGIKYTHDPLAEEYFIDQPVWVVYVEKNKRCYSLWPPLT